MSEFKGKTGIITGATSGIGENIAANLSEKGANLILSGRNKVAGEKLLNKFGKSQSQFVSGDIKLPDTNKKLVETAIENYGKLDFLVLSAGQLGIGRLAELSLEEWHDTIATNLNAVFYLLKYAIPEMQKTGGGNIVIIGSVAAAHAFPNHPAYTASKGALLPLVRQLAKDYGPEFRINLVSPAQVETPLLFNSVKAFENADEILEETANKLPMNRLGIPQDISDMVLFLLGPKASWITGSNFNVDGGFLAT